MSARHNVIDLELHEKQTIAFESNATEILYGGAAGGGKSHLMRAAAITWCAAIAGLQVYLFRRIRDDLVKNHMEGPKGFRSMLAGWSMCGFVKIVDDEIRFWNGSRIYLCHCKDEKDIYKYQGAEIHVLLVDELTHFTESMYRFLRNRVRMVGLTLPAQYAGRFPRILAGANPGNIGHLWVKATFVDAGSYEIYKAANDEGGMMRQFIPALLEDNPSMSQDDPGYELRLQGLGSKELVKAMRYGDWDVIEGAFFDCWDARRHVVRPFEIPRDWLRFMSGDWGSAKPFSFGWWAIASDQTRVEGKEGNTITIPRGCMVRYREWYGASKPNTGLKLHADAVARGIKEREAQDAVKPTYRVLDPAAFAKDGGESIAQAMAREKVSFRPADNARVTLRGAMGGWDQMRGRLVGDGDGHAMVVTFSTCLDSIRTIPAQQHDDARPEDMDSDGEDHCFAAGTMVETEYGQVPIEDLVGTTGRVVTIDNKLAPYRSARMTKDAASLVRVSFENGVTILCTSDHRFMGSDGEWRYAASLNGESITCSQPSLARRSKSSMARDTTSAIDTFKNLARAFTESCGSIITGKSHQDAIFITSTETEAITRSRIYRASVLPIISADVMAARAENVVGGPSRSLIGQLQNGMAPKTAGYGIASISRGTSVLSWIAAFRLFVSNAVKAIWSAPPKQSRDGFAEGRAEHVRCVGVELLKDQRPVYCLTVPSTGCFAIEGGIIVSNCADEWRYACMSRPWVRQIAKPEAKRPSDYRRAGSSEKSWRV